MVDDTQGVEYTMSNGMQVGTAHEQPVVGESSQYFQLTSEIH